MSDIRKIHTDNTLFAYSLTYTFNANSTLLSRFKCMPVFLISVTIEDRFEYFEFIVKPITYKKFNIKCFGYLFKLVRRHNLRNSLPCD